MHNREIELSSIFLFDSNLKSLDAPYLWLLEIWREKEMKRLLSIVLIFLVSFPVISVFTQEAEADSDTTVFQDDFEAHDIGDFPSAGGWELVWNGKGTQYQIVTDCFSHSPVKSLQLWGQSGWSANVQREFTSSSEMIGFEAYVRTENNVGSGWKIAGVCFWTLESDVPWGKRFADVAFGPDGELYTRPVKGSSSYVPLGLTYEADRWYKVTVVIDRTAETYDVWIDDVLATEDMDIWDTYEIDALMLESGHSEVKVYFDNIKVFEGARAYENYARLADARAEVYAGYADVVYYYSAYNPEYYDSSILIEALQSLVPFLIDLSELSAAEIAEDVSAQIKKTADVIQSFENWLDALEEPIEQIAEWIGPASAHAALTYDYLIELKELCKQEAVTWRSESLNEVESILEEEKAKVKWALQYAKGFRYYASTLEDDTAYEVADSTVQLLNRDAKQIAHLMRVARQQKAAIVELGCLANLHLYDSQGRLNGPVYNEQGEIIDIEENIPNSYYIGHEAEPQFVVVFNPANAYAIQVVGRASDNPSDFVLITMFYNETGAVIGERSFADEIVEGAVYVYSVSIVDEAMTANPNPVAELEHLKEFIEELSHDSFNKPQLGGQRRDTLFNKIDEVILKIEVGNYTDAVDKLFHDIRAKMDGDSAAEDWIIFQTTDLCIIIDHIISSIETLQQG